MSIRHLSIVLLSATLLGSCAHVVPKELTEARYAYERARSGPATDLVPADLHKAHEALEQAEKAFDTDPKSYHTRDLAYVAQRSAQKAEALAALAMEKQKNADAQAAFATEQATIVTDTRAELEASRAATVLTTAELADAKAARLAADTRTAAALAKLASMKEEERGLVITLSGSVLFRSSEANLLPEAEIRLNQVAEALLATKERSLVVEGHTDSDGENGYNLDLSQRRADAVRTYLVGRGYDSGLIKAEGVGEERPIADNASPEGKANNRRVEIVVGR